MFLASFATFVIALGFSLAFKPDLLQLSILLPPLLVVGVMPLYVGYMRGTIELRSVRERARGWVYLLFGLGLYSITVAEAPVALGTDLVLKREGAIVVFLLLLLLLWFTKRFVLWFYKTSTVTSITIADKIGIFSVVAGLFVSSMFYQAVLGFKIGTPLNNQPFVYDPITAILVSFAEGIFFLFPLVMLEAKSHHCLDEAATFFEKWRGRYSLKPDVSKWGSNLVDLILLVLLPILLWMSGKQARKFMFVNALSSAIVLVGIFSAAFLGWISAPILFGGDALLFLSLFLHLREFWKD